MRFLVILLLASLPAPLAAGEPLGAAEFDRYTQGRTLFYGFGGSLYGVERYLPDRRVIWSFLDGRCQDGSWYEDAGQICFVYENRGDPQCWTFELTPGGLTARFEDDPDSTELYEAEDIGEEMLCYGPDVGA